MISVVTIVVCQGDSTDTVTEPELSSDCFILTFKFDAWVVRGGVDEADKTVVFYLPQAANLSSLTPSITLSDGATIFPPSGTPIDFSSPVIFTVTAEDGTEQVYTVTVKRESPWIDVTLVGNAGFLIATVKKKILIDAIHVNTIASPSGDVFDRLRFGEPPFDNIDLVFITHNHADHFNASHVATYLERHTNVQLVCPEEVATDVAANATEFAAIQNRITTVTPSTWTEHTIKEINIRTLFLSHGVGMPHNNGYVINLEGHTLIHTGDAEDDIDQFNQYPWLQDEPFKLGFIPWDFLLVDEGDGDLIVQNILRPVFPILMHLRDYQIQILDRLWADITIEYPNLTFFRDPLETQRF